MKASYNWLKELSGVDAPLEEIAERLTSLGLEVEDIEYFGANLDHVVVAEVRAVERVPEKDKLSLVTVFDGEAERTVVCGAPNVPEAGGRVVLAKPGAVLPGDFEIAERTVGGVVSSGMLCSESELHIGEGTEGILVLQDGDRGQPGQLVRDALSLEDAVLEIGLTPNRPDCLGHVGLARELCLAYQVPFHSPEPGTPSRVLARVDLSDGAAEIRLTGRGPGEPHETLTLVDPRGDHPTSVPVRILAPDRCPRYAGCVVHGVTAVPSPFWLRYRLHVLGLRPIDAIVDVSNLVLMELGHPIHTFDLAKLRGPEIVVRLAEEGERFETLDGEQRALCTDDLVICDAEGPVALAGVMGGANSEIAKDTEGVFIEAAYFDPRSIRRTSRRVGLHTDSSHRFERGVDPQGVAFAIRRAASLLCSIAGGAAAPVASDAYPNPVPQQQVDLDPDMVCRLLGVDVPSEAARAALERIGASISPGQTGGWRVSCPTWRPDLSRPEDLVEEVARAIGYDQIPDRLPPVFPSGRGLPSRLRMARKIREAASAVGLLEAVNFAFVSKADLASTLVPQDALELANPLSDERAVMRTSLLPGLVDAVARARRHQATTVALFEVARIYRKRADEALPEEPMRFAVALCGSRVEQVGHAGDLDFYDAKGVVQSVLEAVIGDPGEAVIDASLDTDAPYLHPRRRARLRLGERSVGVLGEIHPDITEARGLASRMVYAELDVELLVSLAAERGPAQARPLPRFPAVSRDLAFEVDESARVGELASTLRAAAGTLCEAVELFDVYRGSGIVEGRKSVAFRVVYRDPAATLTDKRVDKAHSAVRRAVQTELGAMLRE